MYVLLSPLSKLAKVENFLKENSEKSLTMGTTIEIYLKFKCSHHIVRASQWFIFGIAFMILGIILANISSSWQIRCNYEEVIMTNIISCIRANTFAPFPYIFLLFMQWSYTTLISWLGI